MTQISKQDAYKSMDCVCLIDLCAMSTMIIIPLKYIYDYLNIPEIPGANGGFSDAERRHFWNRLDGDRGGSKAA